jgi:peptidoglycan hydrolase-like protein with peptidoglycan-binding domain
MRFSFIIVGVLTLFFSGCATMENGQLTANKPQIQSEISSLQEKTKKLEAENVLLKQQLVDALAKIETLEKTEVRMPTAKEIQTALKNAGFYKGKIDGQIGSQTKEAIKKFQAANNLNSDGVMGSRTWALLLKYLADNKTQ